MPWIVEGNKICISMTSLEFLVFGVLPIYGHNDWGGVNATLVRPESFCPVFETSRSDVASGILVYFTHLLGFLQPVNFVVLNDTQRVYPDVLKS
jgi:hypothetical protein